MAKTKTARVDRAVSSDTPATPTTAEYSTFQNAYDFFNARLFSGELPNVLITLQRHAKARGFFRARSFVGRENGATEAHELALNPDTFETRTDRQIMSTLAHEMAHVWQESHGTPPRRCYHDKQWAGKMKEIGLQPSTTGEPGGKEVGQNVTHYIVDGGPFDLAWVVLEASGFKLNWQSPVGVKAERAKKNASKTKFTCPECAQNAWAKPDARLVCGSCSEDAESADEFVVMIGEPQDDESEKG